MKKKAEYGTFDGIEVRPKTPSRKAEVEAGQLVRWPEDGSIWRVESRTKGSADMKCLRAGKRNPAGRTLACSPHLAGYEVVGEEALAEAKAFDDVAKQQCDNCWAEHAVGEPCRTECPCHEEKRRTRKAPPSDEDVARVLELRAGGMGYAAIEKELGWPDTHGNRPWKICKDAAKEA